MYGAVPNNRVSLSLTQEGFVPPAPNWNPQKETTKEGEVPPLLTTNEVRWERPDLT
jgi:hypothetical protein